MDSEQHHEYPQSGSTLSISICSPTQSTTECRKGRISNKKAKTQQNHATSPPEATARRPFEHYLFAVEPNLEVGTVGTLSRDHRF